MSSVSQSTDHATENRSALRRFSASRSSADSSSGVSSGRRSFTRRGLTPDRAPVTEGQIPLVATAGQRLNQGFGYLSEDRKREGLALPLSIADNLTATKLSAVSVGWGWLDLKRQWAAARSWIDALRIRAVLTNLLSNALRHTPAGGTISLSLRSTKEQVTIAVKDTGEGMSPEDVARMFDRFYKGSTSRGSGLGLTIAKNLVTAHGGEIAASSQVGEGTTVKVMLPRRGQE